MNTGYKCQAGNGKQSTSTRRVTGKTYHSWRGAESRQDAEEINGRTSLGVAGTGRRSSKEAVGSSGEDVYLQLRRLCAGVADAGVTGLCINDTSPFWCHV
jgi:hypothetical protein